LFLILWIDVLFDRNWHLDKNRNNQIIAICNTTLAVYIFLVTFLQHVKDLSSNGQWTVDNWQWMIGNGQRTVNSSIGALILFGGVVNTFSMIYFLFKSLFEPSLEGI